MNFLFIYVFAALLVCGSGFLIARPSALRATDVRVRPRAHKQPQPQRQLHMVADLLVDPNYNLAAGAAVVGTLCGVLEDRLKGGVGKVFGAGAILFTLFGGFVAYQTTTLRFKFDAAAFSLVKSDGSSLGDNVVVGGENAWKYSSFVNYDFLPSREFPILVYFKETQTPEDNWVDAPIVVDGLRGQAHFFPAIANAAQLEENFGKNGCAKVAGEGGAALQATSKVVM